MRWITVAGIVLVLAGSVVAQPQRGADTAPSHANLESARDKASYAIGRNIGNSFKEQGVTGEDVSAAALVAGLRDALSGAKSRLSDEEISAALQAFQKEMSAKVEARNKERADQNRQQGNEFLAENGKKENVKQTASGLQYQIVREGTGPSPMKTDTVEAHYRGKLLSGEVFDQSYEGQAPTAADQPLEIRADQVIKGWTEALQMMKVGGKWRLFIPADLAYGDNPEGPGGPGSVLVFDVELVGIK